MCSWKEVTTVVKEESKAVASPTSLVKILVELETEAVIWATMSVTLFKAAFKPAVATVMTCRVAWASPLRKSPALATLVRTACKVVAKTTARPLMASTTALVAVAIVAATEAVAA